MVQMKVKDGYESLIIPLFFISHMVQMKVESTKQKIIGFALYIPHGSDERQQVHLEKAVYIIFISHMVQMKERSHERFK